MKLTIFVALTIVVLNLVNLTAGVFDQNICSRDQAFPGASQEAVERPILPETFQARIEVTIINDNRTTETTEYFDQPNNRGAVYQTIEGINVRGLYDYDDDEFILDEVDAQKCTSMSLEDTDQRNLLGFSTVNGKARIMTAAQSLHWADPQITEAYMGRTTIRGITVDHWASCQYWAAEDASMEVHWYFVAADGWGTSTNQSQIPVRCWVKGVAAPPGSSKHPFEHYYEFFQFKDKLLDGEGVFEPPSLYPCMGLLNTKDLPTPSSTFSFVSETINFDTKIITYMKEEFDLTHKLVRYTYKPPTSNLVVEIHDFNTGVAYINDPMVGNCSYKAIESGGFDVRQADPNHVRIRTANEFFSFDGTRYNYIGKHKSRLIDCDAWVATRTDFPPGLGLNSTWTWYFASTDWIESTGTVVESGEPVSLKVEIPAYNIHMEYNTYNFIESQPDIFDFDISPCYAFRNRVYVSFTMPGVYNNYIANDRSAFKYSLLLSATGFTAVSPLRVANMNFALSDTNVSVEFEILDIAPPVGDVTNPTPETPLDFAVATLNETIAAGQFVVTILGNEQVFLVAHSDSLQFLYYEAGQAVITPSTRYSPGAMAAIGIIMPIVGGAIGAVGAFFFFK